MQAILIVDDDNIFLDKMYYTLQPEYIIYCLSNPTEVFSFLKQYKVDLIITDLNMPEMTGLELIQKLNNEGNKIPILICTGSPYKIKSIKKLKYDALIEKPPDIKTVFQVVKRILTE